MCARVGERASDAGAQLCKFITHTFCVQREKPAATGVTMSRRPSTNTEDVQVETEGSLHVELLQGTNISTGSKPNVYVKILHDGVHEKVVSSCSTSSNPVWTNQKFNLVMAPNTETITFWVYEKNLIGHESLLGVASLPTAGFVSFFSQKVLLALHKDNSSLAELELRILPR